MDEIVCKLVVLLLLLLLLLLQACAVLPGATVEPQVAPVGVDEGGQVELEDARAEDLLRHEQLQADQEDESCKWHFATLHLVRLGTPVTPLASCRSIDRYDF